MTASKNIAVKKGFPLYAGFEKIDITPEHPVGMELCGMPRLFPGARGILDRLYARAVFLQSGGKKFLMITFDTVYVDYAQPGHSYTVLQESQKISKIISKFSGIEVKDIWLTATHCHSSAGGHAWASPYSRKILERYYVTLQKKTLELAKQVIKNKQRVRISYGTTNIDNVTGSRRVKLSDGTVITGWGSGPTPPNNARIVDRGAFDKQLGAVFFKNIKNKPIGAIVNFSSHIHLYPVLYFTSELAGSIARTLEERMPGSVTVYTNGALGNVSLCPNIAPLSTDPKKWNAQYKRELGKLTRIITEKTLILEKSLKYENRVIIDSCETWLKLKTLTKDNKKEFIAENISGLAINDLVLVAQGEEIFAEYALELREKSPFITTLHIGLKGSENLYLPTDDAMEEGGYEPGDRLELGSINKMIEASVDLLFKLHKRMDS